MKVHKITPSAPNLSKSMTYRVTQEIENARYANDCISPEVMSIETADCGRWHDNHPLNWVDTREAELRKLFPEGK